MGMAREHDRVGVPVYLGDEANGLPVLAQDTLKSDPLSGNLFVFRGKRGGLVKFLFGDGQGFAETGGLLSCHAGSP
jgi:hypothetical protein